MNIRDVIEKLQEVAANLPEGLDSEVEVHICNGHDVPGLRTPSVEVHPVWVMDKKMLVRKQGLAQIQGHPHRDEGSGQTMPVTAQADDILEKWTADQREGGMGLTPVRTPDGEEYLLLPFSDGSFTKFPLIEGIPLMPGAPNAVKIGCTCDPERNNYGRGHRLGDDVQMVVKLDCFVHLKVEGPVDPDKQDWN